MTLAEDLIEAAPAVIPQPSPLGLAPPQGRRGRRRAPAVAGILAVVVGSVWISGIGRSAVVNPQGWSQFSEFFAAAASPRLDGTFLRLTADAAAITLGYALLGTLLALSIGVALGIATADAWTRDDRPHPTTSALRRVLRSGLVPIRSVHEAIYALLLVRVLGINPLVAVLAIGVPFGAVTARVFAQMLDDVEPEPFATLRSMGATRAQAMLYATIPIALRNLVSYAFYRFECAIRSAAVLGVIGAAGLGYQIRLSFQSLRYDEIWTLLYAVILLSGASDFLSARVRAGSAKSGRTGRHWRPATWTVAVAVIVGTPVAWSQLGIHLSTLWNGRATTAANRLFSELLPPEAAGGLGHVFDLAVETFAMAVLAAALATVGAVGIAFIAARRRRDPRGVIDGARWWSVVLAWVARVVLLLARAIPPPIWALVLLFVFFPGVVPGALALSIYTFGVLGRLMAELVENLDGAGADTLRASGASRAQVFLYDRLPRVAPGFAALGLYRWEVATRESVVVGIVAAGGLGYEINQQLAAFDYHALEGTRLALGAITTLAEVASTPLRRTLA